MNSHGRSQLVCQLTLGKEEVTLLRAKQWEIRCGKLLHIKQKKRNYFHSLKMKLVCVGVLYLIVTTFAEKKNNTDQLKSQEIRRNGLLDIASFGGGFNFGIQPVGIENLQQLDGQAKLENGFRPLYSQIPQPQPRYNHELDDQAQHGVKTITLTKKVPVPYEVTVEKKVPVKVEVPVDKPYTVYVPKPYHFYVEKKVPVEVKVPVPQPYTVEKHIPVPYKVHIDRPYPVHVAKPYPVYIEKKVPYTVEKPVPHHVKYPVDKPYPVNVPYEKIIHYPVEKKVPYAVRVPVEKAVPLPVDKPIPYPVVKHVSYPVERIIKYPVKEPVRVHHPHHLDASQFEYMKLNQQPQGQHGKFTQHHHRGQYIQYHQQQEQPESQSDYSQSQSDYSQSQSDYSQSQSDYPQSQSESKFESGSGGPSGYYSFVNHG